MIHSKQETREYFSQSYDLYGDSFYEDLTVESIKKLFFDLNSSEMFKIEREKINLNLREQIAEIENKYYPDESFKFGLFRLYNIYFDNESNKKFKNTSLFDLLGIKIRWRGGRICNKIDSETTHCIVDKK
jgi:hypothetical protein